MVKKFARHFYLQPELINFNSLKFCHTERQVRPRSIYRWVVACASETSGLSEAQDHQFVIDIVVANFQGFGFNPVTLKAQ